MLRRRVRIGTAAAQIAATIGLSAALLAVTVLSLIDDLGAPVVPHRIESESFSYCASCHAPPRVLPGLPIPEPGTNRRAPVHENIIVHSGGELCVSCHSHLPVSEPSISAASWRLPLMVDSPMSTLRVAARVRRGWRPSPLSSSVSPHSSPTSRRIPGPARRSGTALTPTSGRRRARAVLRRGIHPQWSDRRAPHRCADVLGDRSAHPVARRHLPNARDHLSHTALARGRAVLAAFGVGGVGGRMQRLSSARSVPVRSFGGRRRASQCCFSPWFSPDGRPLGRAWSWALLGFAVHVAAWSIFPGSVIDPRGGRWRRRRHGRSSLPSQRRRHSSFDTAAWKRSDARRFGLSSSPSLRRSRPSSPFGACNRDSRRVCSTLCSQPRRLEALHDLNLLLLLTISLLLLPVAVGVSVVRYRLWDMGLLVNRAIVYGALTAMVAASFLVGMVGVGSLLTGRVGNGRGVAGVVTGVALVLVFQPVRRRVQAAVDRRFYREKYDADRAVDHFARVVTDLVDAQSVADAIDVVLRDTVHPTDSWIVLDDAIGLSSGTEPVDRTDRNLGRTPYPNCGPMEPCSPSRSSPRAGPWGPCFSDHGVRVGHTPHSIDAHWKGLRGRLLLRCASASWSKRRSVRLSKRPASTARWRWRERFSATCCRNSFRRLQAGDSPPATSRRERSAATTTTSSPR